MNVEPRPLTDEERSILDLLLTPTFDGVEQLRQQVAEARVVGGCGINLDVDRWAATVIGVLLIVLGGVVVLGDSDNLSARMPTQVVPRRYARYPFGAGTAVALIVLLGVVSLDTDWRPEDASEVLFCRAVFETRDV